MFSNMLRMLLTSHEVSLSLSLYIYIYIYMSIMKIMVCMFQEISKKSLKFYSDVGFNIVIPGSEVPKWFTHQSVGDTVSAQVTL